MSPANKNACSLIYSPLLHEPIKIAEISSVAGLPSEYHDLTVAFSKTEASQLPPHRPSDCAIDLLPGSSPSRDRVFPLSQPESEAMKAYIEEELSKGFIRPSTSPASAGFFVKKEDGGGRVEDGFLYYVRALRISCYAIRIGQQSFSLPSLHKRRLS